MKVFPSIKFYASWEWDFYLVMILAATAQLIPIIIEFVKTPLKMIKYLANFTFISISTTFVSSCDILSYLITRKSFFPVSGSNVFQAESNIILRSEIILCLILGYLAVYTTNIWLLSIALTFGLDTLFYKLQHQNAVLNALIYLPFITNVLIIAVIGFYLL